MSDVFCSNCGHRNQAGSNFCSSCGQPLERAPEEPATITFTLDSESGELVEVDLGSVPPGGRLIVTRGPNTGSEWDLEHVITTAGRHPDSDIFLDDVTVSRRHAEFRREGSGYAVHDVGSLNGTYVNREPIDFAPLSGGDEVQIGKFRLVYLTAAVRAGSA